MSAGTFSGTPAVVMCFATQGAGSNDEERITALLEDFGPSLFAYDRLHKHHNIARLLRTIRAQRPSLVVMEGTGIAGGAGLILARLLLGTRYVVSSGDAVGPFLSQVKRVPSVWGWLYELLLYRLSAGFIGWTPYLAGRALTMGAPRAMTAANFASFPEVLESRAAVRARLGIAEGALVFGLVGSLSWNPRHAYCYGLELVKAVRRSGRRDVSVLVVGDGDGLDRLRALAGPELGQRVFVPGAVPRDHVGSYLAAMDVGSLPQSVDQVGSFRYTTKVSEYLRARLPFVTGQIPMAYDLVDEWTWRLPGRSPWSDTYVDALAELIDSLDGNDVAARRARIPAGLNVFDRASQQRRITEFVGDLLAGRDA